MKIWIILNGEKVGPFNDFEIRRKIQTGQLLADTPAWHEKITDWKPLIEIDLFTREFLVIPTPLAPPPMEEPIEESTTEPSNSRQPTYYIRRFWARWFDLTLFASLWWFGMWAIGQNINGILNSAWMMILLYLPWFAIESMLIHYSGTTPGKWLLGIKVTNLDHSRLSLSASTIRAVRVLCTGIGFGWGFLALFCQSLSLFTARRLGRAFWDHLGQHQATVRSLQPLRVIFFIVVFFITIQLQAAVLTPYLIDTIAKEYPEIKKAYDQNPPWHFPKR